MKYNKFRFCLIMILFAAVTTQAQEQDSLTLEQVIQKVLEKNLLIEQSVHKIAAVNAKIELSKSVNYPLAAASVSYNRIGPLIELTIPDAGSFSLFPANNYDAHIAAEYTIYDFGKSKTATELAENDLLNAQQNAQVTRNALAYQTVNLFYAILFLQQNIRVVNEEISALQSHLDIAQKREQTGSATSFDILTTRVRVSNAENQKVDLESMLQKQWLFLKSLMGGDKDQKALLSGDFKLNFTLPVDQSSLLTQALNERQEMKLAENNTRHFEIALQLSKLSNSIQFKANGLAGVKNGYIPDLNELKFNWVAGVGLHIPLFDGYATDFREQLAQANLSAAQAYRDEVRRRVSTEVNQAIEDVLAQKKKLNAVDLQLEQASEAVSLANKQYEAGVVTNLELLDAHTAQAQSRLLKSKALYNLAISEYKLQQAIGGKNW